MRGDSLHHAREQPTADCHAPTLAPKPSLLRLLEEIEPIAAHVKHVWIAVELNCVSEIISRVTKAPDDESVKVRGIETGADFPVQVRFHLNSATGIKGIQITHH